MRIGQETHIALCGEVLGEEAQGKSVHKKVVFWRKINNTKFVDQETKGWSKSEDLQRLFISSQSVEDKKTWELFLRISMVTRYNDIWEI